MSSEQSSNQSTATPAPAAPDRPVRIGDVLEAKGLLDSEQIQQAVTHQHEKGHNKLLGEVLVEMGFVTEDQVMEVLAEAYGIPFARITPKVADPNIIETLPREFLEKQCVVPLFLVNGKLTVAVHEPTNVFLVEEIARLSGCTVQLVAGTVKDIRLTVEAHLPNANVFILDEITEDTAGADLTLVEDEVTDLGNLEEMAGDSPVIKLVNYLIASAIEDGASDVHIEAGDKMLRARFRVDGSLFEKMRPPIRCSRPSSAASRSWLGWTSQSDVSHRTAGSPSWHTNDPSTCASRPCRASSARRSSSASSTTAAR